MRAVTDRMGRGSCRGRRLYRRAWEGVRWWWLTSRLFLMCKEMELPHRACVFSPAPFVFILSESFILECLSSVGRKKSSTDGHTADSQSGDLGVTPSRYTLPCLTAKFWFIASAAVRRSQPYGATQLAIRPLYYGGKAEGCSQPWSSHFLSRGGGLTNAYHWTVTAHMR